MSVLSGYEQGTLNYTTYMYLLTISELGTKNRQIEAVQIKVVLAKDRYIFELIYLKCISKVLNY